MLKLENSVPSDVCYECFYDNYDIGLEDCSYHYFPCQNLCDVYPLDFSLRNFHKDCLLFLEPSSLFALSSQFHILLHILHSSILDFFHQRRHISSAILDPVRILIPFAVRPHAFRESKICEFYQQLRGGYFQRDNYVFSP